MVFTSVTLRISEDFGVVGVDIFLTYGGRSVIDFEEFNNSLAEVERLLDGTRNAGLKIWAEDETVYDEFDVVTFVFVEFWKFVQSIDDAVHANAGKTFGVILLANVGELTFLLRNDWGKKHEFGAERKFHDFVDDIFNGAARNFFTTNWTMWYTDASKQKAEIIINFGDRSNGGTWVAAGRFLINRNGWTEAGDGVNVWFIHHAKEHTGVRTERLDITALAFGVDGIKSQAGFT